jgi:hypothetical protein
LYYGHVKFLKYEPGFLCVTDKYTALNFK